MLRTFMLSCRTDAPCIRWDAGAYLHGYLMESLPQSLSDAAHGSGLRPFSQFILPEKNGFFWRLSCWDDALSDSLSRQLQEGSEFSLRQKGMSVRIERLVEESLTEPQFFSRFFLSEDVNRRFELRFLTPCAHRQSGAYALFPSAELILNSLYARFCSFSRSLTLEDEAALKAIVESAHIERYALRSAVYHLESGAVTGYVGSVTLRFSGSAQLARLGGMMLAFAPYAGVGAKTALGMGGSAICANPTSGHAVTNGEKEVRTEKVDPEANSAGNIQRSNALCNEGVDV